MRIKGGPELRARLASVVAAGPEIRRAWAEDAASRISRAAPRRTGSLASSIKPGEKGGKSVVVGNWYGVILDRGTKRYSITPKRAQALRYTYRGRTIFGKRSNRRPLRRRPFITHGAQGALRSTAMTHAIIAAWNRRAQRGRFTRFAL